MTVSERKRGHTTSTWQLTHQWFKRKSLKSLRIRGKKFKESTYFTFLGKSVFLPCIVRNALVNHETSHFALVKTPTGIHFRIFSNLLTRFEPFEPNSNLSNVSKQISIFELNSNTSNKRHASWYFQKWNYENDTSKKWNYDNDTSEKAAHDGLRFEKKSHVLQHYLWHQ